MTGHTEAIVTEALKDARVPITYNEMQALLEPLQSCLHGVEKALQELSKASSLGMTDKAPAAKHGVFPHGSRNTQDVEISTNDVVLSSAAQTGNNGTDKSLAQQTMQWQWPTLRKNPDEPSLKKQASNHSRSANSATGDVKHRIDLIEEHRIEMAFKELGQIASKSMLDKVTLSLEKWTLWWDSIQEPQGTSWIFRLSVSPSFETVCMIAIMLNSVLVAYVSDWQIQHIGRSEPAALDIFESSFFVFFFVELCLRLLAHQCYFFVNKDMHWNIFDLILVSISFVDFVFDKILRAQAGSNVGFMRLLRLFKMARILRSLRSFRFLKSLAVLLDSFWKSAVSLFWGLVMLAFVLYLFGLIFIQALVEYLTVNDDLDPNTENAIMSRFGSLYTTLVTLYMSVTGGDDWGISYDIVRQSGASYGVLFCFFTFFFLFALFNILTGSLVEKAMTSAKPNRAEHILNHRKHVDEQRTQFLEMCRSMDTDNNGMISWVEFLDWMRNPIMVSYMSSVGIEVDNIELFFSSVDAKHGHPGSHREEIPIEQFVEGCMSMQGEATAIDMQRVLFEMQMVHSESKHMQTLFTRGMEELRQEMRRKSFFSNQLYQSL